MALDFADKLNLASEAIDKALNVKGAGQIIKEVLNEHGYEDGELICEDLEEYQEGEEGDSVIMSDIQTNAMQNLTINWDDRTQRLFYQTLNDIFSHNITNFDQLMYVDESYIYIGYLTKRVSYFHFV